MDEKRFKLSKINPSVNPFDTVYFIIDFENPSNKIRNLKDCCDVLNEQQATISTLKKENEQLRRQNKALKESSLADAYFQYLGEKQFNNYYYTGLLNSFHQQNYELQKENEQLKQENKKLKKQLMKFPPKIREVWL